MMLAVKIGIFISTNGALSIAFPELAIGKLREYPWIYIKVDPLECSDMIKITPFLGIIVPIVSSGGIFYPELGYFLLLVFARLMR